MADVFHKMHGLGNDFVVIDGRAAPVDMTTARARAIADNRRLWIALDASLRHPANQLPQDTKVTMIQVGRTVMREMENAAPDLAFLIEINEQLTSGLR